MPARPVHVIASPAGWLAFPSDCLSCSSEGEVHVQLSYFDGIDVGVVAVGPTLRLPARACRRCRRRWLSVAAALAVLVLGAGFGAFAGVLAASDPLALRVGTTIAAVSGLALCMGAVVGAIGLVRSAVPRWADRLAYGTWIGRWERGSDLVTIATRRTDLGTLGGRRP